MLNHREADADLAGVRDAAARARLPEEERAAWQALRDEFDAAIQAVEPAAKPSSSPLSRGKSRRKPAERTGPT
jgi:hypothetical protein